MRHVTGGGSKLELHLVAIVVVNRFYAPDVSATSQLVSQLGERLVRSGFPVIVACGRFRHQDFSAPLPRRETVEGVDVRRVGSTRFGRDRLLGRSLDVLTLYLGLVVLLLRTVRRGDIVLAKTDPPMLSALCGAIARVRGAHLVNWVQDVFPETAERLGVGLAGGVPGVVLRWLRNRAARRAVVNVAIGERMRGHLAACGVPPERLAVIHNWAEAAVRPVAPAENELRTAWGLQGRFVVGYSGNMGRAHEFETLLAAAPWVEAECPSVTFLLIGAGHHRRRLEAEVAQRGLGNVMFQDFQPRERLAMSLSVPDVHLVSLLPALEGLIVPSKFYGILAAGRPVFFIGDEEGEVARIIRAEGCGAAFPVGDGRALAAGILLAESSPSVVAAWSSRALELSRTSFAREASLEAWVHLLEKVGAKPAMRNWRSGR